MSNLLQKTKGYVEAFNAKDLTAIKLLMAEDFSITDPNVSGLSPRADVLKYISDIFDNSGKEFCFQAKNIWQSGNITFVEFRLDVGDDKLEGVDIIEWKGEVMQRLTAYLYPRLRDA